MSLTAETVADGKHLDYTPSADVAAGTIVAINQILGVTKLDIPANQLGALHTFHVVRVPKATGAGTDIAFGVNLFWDSDPGVATKTAADGKHMGVCVNPASTTDAYVEVLLRPASVGTAANVAALGQTTSGTYQQAEVQAIATKVDAILTALKNAGLMLTA